MGFAEIITRNGSSPEPCCGHPDHVRHDTMNKSCVCHRGIKTGTNSTLTGVWGPTTLSFLALLLGLQAA